MNVRATRAGLDEFIVLQRDVLQPDVLQPNTAEPVWACERLSAGTYVVEIKCQEHGRTTRHEVEVKPGRVTTLER